VTGTTNNGGEDGAGGIITGETGLDHAGAVVNDESLNVLIHVLEERCGVCRVSGLKEK
jgi:hypothetical protein